MNKYYWAKISEHHTFKTCYLRNILSYMRENDIIEFGLVKGDYIANSEHTIYRKSVNNILFRREVYNRDFNALIRSDMHLVRHKSDIIDILDRGIPSSVKIQSIHSLGGAVDMIVFNFDISNAYETNIYFTSLHCKISSTTDSSWIKEGF